MRIRIRAPTMSGREPDCRDTSTRQQYKAAKIYTMLGQQVLLLRNLGNKCNKSTRQPASPRGPRAPTAPRTDRKPHKKPMHFLADSAPRAPWGRAPLLRPHPASGTARATRFPALAIQDGSKERSTASNLPAAFGADGRAPGGRALACFPAAPWQQSATGAPLPPSRCSG